MRKDEEVIQEFERKGNSGTLMLEVLLDIRKLLGGKSKDKKDE